MRGPSRWLLVALGVVWPATSPSAQAPAMEFVTIQPGAFMMGCAEGDPRCDDDERPAHEVRITRPFEMGKYEVTQEQWEGLMMNRSRFVGDPRRPADRVSWNDAQEFIGKLNARQDGYTYRLPSEAEWEYAAHAGTTGPYAAPSLEALGWFEANSNRQTHPVGQKAPNAWGLYDMHGNVFEHVQDWWSSKTYAAGSVVDPTGPAEGEPITSQGNRTLTVRVAKGGSYYGPEWSARISNRGVGPVNDRADTTGLRLVRTRTAEAR